MKMTEEKKVKVEFAPGAFDSFEGTQEELDELLAEIYEMFEGKSPEELAAMSRPLSDEDFYDLPDDVKEDILRQLAGDDLSDEFKRKLQ